MGGRAFGWCDQRSASPVAAVAKAALDSGAASADCPSYLGALESALQYEPPPYGMPGYTDLYREAAQDAQWLAISLMSNASGRGRRPAAVVAGRLRQGRDDAPPAQAARGGRVAPLAGLPALSTSPSPAR